MLRRKIYGYLNKIVSADQLASGFLYDVETHIKNIKKLQFFFRKGNIYSYYTQQVYTLYLTCVLYIKNNNTKKPYEYKVDIKDS